MVFYRPSLEYKESTLDARPHGDFLDTSHADAHGLLAEISPLER